MDFKLEELIPEVSEERGYWLVRSMGGRYYDEFVDSGFIAIGFEDVSLNEVKFAVTTENPPVELKKIIDSKEAIDEKDEKRLDYTRSYGTSQLIRFNSELKEDDIVVIPSSSDKYMIAIGIIESNVYELDKKDLNVDTRTYCQFRKRRNISIIKQISREALNPEMNTMFNSRHIISDVSKYAEYIDSNIRDFYQKGDKTFLILRVKQEEDISALDFSLVTDLIDVVGGFCKESNIEFDKQSIKMKVYVQSPGAISIFASMPGIILVLGIAISFFKGVEFNGWGMDFKTTSGLENISKLIISFAEYMDRKQYRKSDETIRKKLENLDIDTPEDVRMLLEEMRKRRNKV